MNETEARLPRRLPGIDVLRALAAWAVVLSHVVKWPMGYAGDVGPIGALWRFIGIASGTWGVGIFFVLSGTCIHLPMARRLAHESHPALDLRAFFRRRFLRIYPPHLLAIFLSWATAAVAVLPAVFEPLVSTPTAVQFWSHLAMVHTFVPGAFYSINVVLWSIALEAHFYLLYPLVLIARRRFRMETICVALFATMLALRLLDRMLPPALAGVLTYNFLGRWWEWVLGAVIAERLVQNRGAARTPWPWAVGLAVASAVFATLVTRLPHGILLAAVGGPWLYAVVVLVVALMAPARGRIPRALAWSGVRSYSLYLTHPIALTLVAYVIAGRGAAWVQTATALVVAHLCAWAYFVTVESRFMTTPSVSPSGTGVPAAPDAGRDEPSPRPI